MSNQQKSIFVVGSINMDLVAQTPRIPLAGQSLIGTDFATTPGGKGANQAVAVARLGSAVQMLGAVGEDVFGQALVDNLASAGVGTAAVRRVTGPSGVALIFLAENGENSIVAVQGANGKVDPQFIDHHSELIRSAGLVLCQLELPMQTINRTLEVCSEAGVPVILDPAPAAPIGRPPSSRVWLIGPAARVLEITAIPISDSMPCQTVPERTPESRPAE